MSDEKKYTERDMVLAKRAGFAAACAHLGRYAHAEDAMIRYPLPKITRPRVVADPHCAAPAWGGGREWTCIDGQLYSRTIGQRIGFPAGTPYPWSNRVQIPPTPERVALWANLLANPTEEVES